MRWTRIALLCGLGLGLSCVSGDGFVADDGLVSGDVQTVDFVTDGVAPDLISGAIVLEEGHISTLGGPGSATLELLEGKPDFEVSEDGLEYSGVHGALCSADQDYCITEGGIAP